MKDDLMKMHLQFFAEENNGKSPDTPDEQDQTNEDESKKPKYTDEEVDALIDKKFAKWQADRQKEIEDAERKAKLSEKERLAEEKSELQKKIEEYERKDRINQNASMLSKSLSDANLPHDDDLINLIANEDESVSKEALNIVVDYVSKIKKQASTTGTPSEGQQFKAQDTQSLSKLAKEKRIIK